MMITISPAEIVVTTDDGGKRVVTVPPITHTHRANSALSVEIPHETKRRLFAFLSVKVLCEKI
jgi:hypothetical protein